MVALDTAPLFAMVALVRTSGAKVITNSERWVRSREGGNPARSRRFTSTTYQHPRRRSRGALPSITWPSWDTESSHFHPSIEWDELPSQPPRTAKNLASSCPTPRVDFTRSASDPAPPRSRRFTTAPRRSVSAAPPSPPLSSWDDEKDQIPRASLFCLALGTNFHASLPSDAPSSQPLRVRANNSRRSPEPSTAKSFPSLRTAPLSTPPVSVLPAGRGRRLKMPTAR